MLRNDAVGLKSQHQISHALANLVGSHGMMAFKNAGREVGSQENWAFSPLSETSASDRRFCVGEAHEASYSHNPRLLLLGKFERTITEQGQGQACEKSWHLLRTLR